jgi:hypothetical protein
MSIDRGRSYPAIGEDGYPIAPAQTEAEKCIRQAAGPFVPPPIGERPGQVARPDRR